MNLPAPEAADTLSYYWFHQLIASALWGVSFFLAGLLLAALLWGGARHRANRIRQRNQRLLAECQQLERSSGLG